VTETSHGEKEACHSPKDAADQESASEEAICRKTQVGTRGNATEDVERAGAVVKTPIGQQLSGSSWRLAAATAVGALAVAGHLLSIHFELAAGPVSSRCLFALVSVAALLLFVRGDRQSLGLNLAPVQGWKYWCRVTLVIGLVLGVVVGGLSAIVWAVCRLRGEELPLYATPPDQVRKAFVSMCIAAPLWEESIYRVAVCVPAVILLRPAGAIIVSGLVFGLMHVVAGVPGPDNLIAGFFLAWAYLKSGSIAVPIAWHSLGNLFALAVQVGMWYWQGSPAV